jgi:toxin ParE1/3/4
LSRLAEADLTDIGSYTLRTWGEEQAMRYLEGLEACCQQLADNPELGRACDHIRPGLRRVEHGRHVVFYRIEGGTIVVSRILHQSMLPERRSIDEQNP